MNNLIDEIGEIDDMLIMHIIDDMLKYRKSYE